MLDRADLVRLYRDLRDRPVLSVYLDVDQHDPAQRRAWRTRLENEVSNEARRIANGGADDGDFRAALGHLESALQDDGFMKGRGWVGFATPDALVHHESLPVPMPNLVRWEDGIRAAPYIRGLKRLRRIAVVVADRRRARLFDLSEGELRERPSLVADQDLGDLSDVGVRKAGTNRSGRRGETATDQAQRILEENAERMWKSTVEQASEIAGSEGFVVIGGTPEATGRIESLLPSRLRERTETSTHLHLDMSPNEVREAVSDVAAALNQRLQGELVDGVVDQARSGGRGVLGRDATVDALREMRVDTLLVSRSFMRDDPELADRCVGTALAQDAEVEEVSGAGADRLDAEGDGMGARLRYRIDEVVAAAD